MELDYSAVSRDNQFREVGYGENTLNKTISSNIKPENEQNHFLEKSRFLEKSEQKIITSEQKENNKQETMCNNHMKLNNCYSSLCHNYPDFWFNNPAELINEFYLLPTEKMTMNQKLNSLVRGSIVF